MLLLMECPVNTTTTAKASSGAVTTHIQILYFCLSHHTVYRTEKIDHDLPFDFIGLMMVVALYVVREYYSDIKRMKQILNH